MPPPPPPPPPPTAPPAAPPPATTEAAPDEAPLVVGAVDDSFRDSERNLDQAAAAGFDAIGITSYWEPGLTQPSEQELAVLARTTERAVRRRMRVYLAVFHRGSSTTPLDAGSQAEFAAYVATIVGRVPAIRDVVVGNEPNLNRFWLPQFGPNGENVASADYYRLLATVYDAAKDASDARIWGGALAPRGVDRPNTGRDTQSPRRFLAGLAAAHRASGRDAPPLDGFAFHPYPPSSSIPPDRPSPPGAKSLGLADYERLDRLVAEAFGRPLPLLYSELGVESAIPEAKAGLYTGREVGDPVDEATQADFYRRALRLASCQPNVRGILLFHSHDEPALEGFQSGVYYVDGTPKASLEPVRAAIEAARGRC